MRNIKLSDKYIHRIIKESISNMLTDNILGKLNELRKEIEMAASNNSEFTNVC